jgi:hypothetical protein
VVKRVGIFCVEGGWSSRLTDNDSVLPLLTFIRGNGEVPFIHRYVETVDALESLLSKWPQKQYERYSLGYLGFHGSPGILHLGRRRVSLEMLATMLGTSAAGKFLYVGSCGVLDVEQDRLRAFVRATRLRGIAGYRADVDWFESSAFDLLLFDALTRYERPTAAENWLRRRVPDLMENLRCRFFHRSQLAQ